MKLKTIKMKSAVYLSTITLSAFLIGCGEKKESSADDHEHSHDEAGVHSTQNAVAEKEEAEDQDHAHDEVALGEFSIGEYKVKAAQGHGNLAAGKEGHLVVTLPYKDDGQTVTRAWIGTEDRTLSAVGKGEYAPSHDDYDIHAIAPDPLPADAKWWLEIEKPDGTKTVGSIPLLKDIKK